MSTRDWRLWAVISAFVFIFGGVLLWRGSYQPPSHDEASDATITGPEETKKTVKIGVVSPTMELNPVYEFLSELAFEEINAWCNESGVGYQFDFVFTCAGGTGADALYHTQSYHEAGIDLVVGYGWSSQLCVTRSYAEINGMVIVSPSSSSPQLAIEDDIFRLCPHDWMFTRPTAKTMWSRGVTDVVIIHRGDVWADGFVEGFREEYSEIGGRVNASIRYAIETEGAQFKAVVEQADNAVLRLSGDIGAEHAGVLLLGFSEVADILAEVGTTPPLTSLMNVTWFSVEEMGRSETIRVKADGVAKRVRLLSPDPEAPETEAYRRVSEAYRGAFDEPLGFYDANIYDCCWIMALSVIEADSTDSSKVAEAIPEVASSYTGASGNCHLDPNGDRDAVDYAVWGFFDMDGECRILRCGTYHHDSDDVEWDETLMGKTQN